MTARRPCRLFSASLFGCAALVLAGACAQPGVDARAEEAPVVSAPEMSSAPPLAEAASAPATAIDVGQGIRAALSAVEAPQGGIIRIAIEADPKTNAEDVSATFDGKEIPFFILSEPGRFGAVFGVNHDLKPGKHEMKIRAGEKKGSVSLNIVDGNFRSEKLTVSAKHVNPPKKEMKRILAEQKEIGAIYRKVTRDKMWDGPFKLPIDSPVTSPFGNRRMYNGEQRNYHPGMDLKAATGTEIEAPAGGKIVLAKNLYFTGNTVGIDHGYGVITLYAHMSKIFVKLGEKVGPGRKLGLSGMTGRVSGPHLHWQAVLQGVKVNPMELTRVMR